MPQKTLFLENYGLSAKKNHIFSVSTTEKLAKYAFSV